MTAYEPKELIVEFLRHRLTDPRSRHTSTSDTFSGDGSTKTFTLTPTAGRSVQCITNASVDGTDKLKWQDYTFDPTFQSKVVTFNSAPANGSDNIVITYDEGTTDWIYPDLAKTTLSTTSYPIMNVLIVNSVGNRMGSYSAPISSTERYQIDIWVKEKYVTTIGGKKYEGDKLAMYLARQVNLAFEDYIDDLYPKLKHYRLLNIRDGVWDTERQVYHVIVEIELEGTSLGE